MQSVGTALPTSGIVHHIVCIQVSWAEVCHTNKRMQHGAQLMS